jgi:hypothetical protein
MLPADGLPVVNLSPHDAGRLEVNPPGVSARAAIAVLFRIPTGPTRTREILMIIQRLVRRGCCC